MYFPSYPGDDQFFCDKVPVPVSIAIPSKSLKREYYSADGRRISTSRLSGDDVEVLVYPLTYVIIVELDTGEVMCPVWRRHVEKKENSLFSSEDVTFSNVRVTLRGIPPRTQIDIPVDDRIQSITFLLNDKYSESTRYDTQEYWHVYTVGSEQLSVAYRDGLFFPRITELNTVASSKEGEELWRAYQSAIIEYKSTVLERGYY